MSGDVQPRKRKDKKRKKDELGLEEPRGTSAVFGEGDVFMHSQHNHGTGGHWCAKIIFFSLLAVLVTLIGLIILENRGLSELEANAVESRYSGVLDGWIEEGPSDEHHDEHTLDLRHHDEKENELEGDDQDIEANDEDNENVAYGNEDNENEIDDDNNSKEPEGQNLEENREEAEEEQHYDSTDKDTNYNENDVSNEFHINYESKVPEDNAKHDVDDDYYNENDVTYDYSTRIQTEDNLKYDIEDDEDDDENDDEETGVEIERIERQISEEVLISTELPALPEQDDGDRVTTIGENYPGLEDNSEEEEDNNEEFLESDDDLDAPIVEPIVVPAGKPFVEVDEETSSEKPIPSVPDTLAEEEEYEKRQEELRREEEQASHKDGGNSVEEEWPGEPSDPYWRQQLDEAEEELGQGAWSSCRSRVSSRELANSGRARWLAAQALDVAAEQRRDNTLLSQAITAYLHLLKMNERLSDKKILEVTKRTINRIQFRGTYLSAEPVYRLLIRRFPNDPDHRNNLSTSFLMANRADLAEEVLKETLARWPNDRHALAHYGFVLKTQHNRLEEAVIAFENALEGDTGPANEPRFYYHLGDSLILLGRYAEAHEVHKRATALGHFLSPAQRSLYNVPRLKSRPWWNVENTPYVKLARALENSWRYILKEGEAARELYEKEKEGLKERGDWSQLDLFVRGREIPDRCKNAPVTCSIVRAEAAAVGCRRGQVKFSSMAAGTHVRPHVGPTNCRLRMHLGLSNTKNTFIRVDQETRQWEVGKVLLFDDSFEHEVWHNGTGARLVLIVDVWHPDLTPAERRQLPAI